MLKEVHAQLARLKKVEQEVDEALIARIGPVKGRIYITFADHSTSLLQLSDLLSHIKDPLLEYTIQAVVDTMQLNLLTNLVKLGSGERFDKLGVDALCGDIQEFAISRVTEAKRVREVSKSIVRKALNDQP